MTPPRRSFWSWFAKSKRALTQPEVAERLEQIERALELKYVEKPQAEANQATGQAAAQLITALEHTTNAVVQIGTLLIVKSTNAAGQHCVYARTLTQSELEMVEKHPELLAVPGDVLLNLARAQLPPASDKEA